MSGTVLNAWDISVNKKTLCGMNECKIVMSLKQNYNCESDNLCVVLDSL